jgi:acetyl/propionyl-CoA carboxylase alpha subunit
VLVANRGEIARRLFAACRQLGIESVAVASEPDRDAYWTRSADRLLPLAGATAGETYLDAEAILRSAREAGADAVHPGYGFLSENADFATAVAEAGLAFVGPGPDAMRALGSKVGARQAAEAAGVPVVPGADGAGLDEAAMARAAERIGYPVLIKASAGGGGRGMRVVEDPADFPAALAAARAEAAGAFGDDHMLLERYFDRVHHVEVQVLGDLHGQVVHLFERECSVQRRHQKVIEESPAPVLTPEVRARMTAAAVDLARAVGYTSAGTVEFLVDEGGGFYLLEMNTRLQVEHPVSEAVTGLDLAAWQLRVAGGEPLGFRQADLVQRGHAIEARIYAEDPGAGFRPSTGRLGLVRWPAGPGLRVDDGVATGSEVSPYYDAMLAKVIARGADRAEALRRLRLGLADTVLLGVTANVAFLQDVLAHPDFAAGRADTRWLERVFGGWAAPAPADGLALLAMAAYEAFGAGRAAAGSGTDRSAAAEAGPWAAGGGWRNVP